MLKILIMTMVLFSSVYSKAQTELTVEVHPVRSNLGHVLFTLYNSEQSYLAEDDGYSNGSIPAVLGTIQFVIQNIVPGFYGLTMFHDENDNGKLDTNSLGQPKELFGISNITRKLWSKPKWDEIKFEIKDGQENEISILLKLQ